MAEEEFSALMIPKVEINGKRNSAQTAGIDLKINIALANDDPPLKDVGIAEKAQKAQFMKNDRNQVENKRSNKHHNRDRDYFKFDNDCGASAKL